MPYSMTGYGRYSGESNRYSVSVEIRSVNHRFLDITVRLPKNYIWLEETSGKIIKSVFSRGKIDCFMQIQPKPDAKVQEVQLNQELLRDYLKMFTSVKRWFHIPGRIRVEHLLTIPDLFIYTEPEENREEISILVSDVIKKAVTELLNMRKKEGEIIAADLTARISNLEEKINEVEKISHQLPIHYREKLLKSLKELAVDTGIDENRLSAEVLFYAERSSITEETVRFKSHLQQFYSTLRLNEPIGRKLDFITQELHRETNTIASKAGDLAISQYVVEIKTEIEKIREQVQNIE